MHRPYISVQARIITVLMGLVFVCLAVLCGTSYSLSRNVLVQMQNNNVDLNTHMKQEQISDYLQRLLTQTVHTSVSQSVQQILLDPNNSTTLTLQEYLLSESLDSSSMIAVSIYNKTGASINSVSLVNDSSTLNSSLFPVSYSPDTNTTVMTELYTNGAYATVPSSTLNSTDTSFYLSISVPVQSTEPWDTYDSTSDLLSSKRPYMGFLTCVFVCGRVQQLLGSSYSSTFVGANLSASTTSSLTVLGDEPNLKVVLPENSRAKMVGSTHLVPEFFWQQLSETKETSAIVDSGGLLSAAAFKFVNIVYVVMVIQSRDQVTSMVQSLLNILVAAGCAILVGAFLLVLVMTWFGTRPLLRVVNATKNVNSVQDNQSEKTLVGQNEDIADIRKAGTEASNRSFELSDSQSSHAVNTNQLTKIRTDIANLGRNIKTKLSLADHDANRLSAVEAQLPIAGAVGTEEAGLHFEIPQKIILKRKHLRDEVDKISLRLNIMTEALETQYRILEERVEMRKREIEEAKQIADEANAAKSHFLARVTHELRTPLNGILGTATLCLDEESIPEIRSSLKTIFKCGELLLHLLTDLLSFSQNEVDDLKLDESEFKISDITSQLLAIFREQSVSAHVALDIDPVPECGSYIMFGDINRILQVVFNLMSNSLKFTPEGGKVSFRASVVKIAGSSKRKVTFKVTDTGPGIAPHLQARVFDAFVQGDINVNVRRAGVGLGLSICKQLAEFMGGSIGLESTLGEGSEFTFTVPLEYIGDNKDSDSSGQDKQENEWPEYDLYSADTIRRKAQTELKSGSKSNLQTPAPTPNSSSGNQFERLTPITKTSKPQSEQGKAATLIAPKVWNLERPEMKRGLSLDGISLPNMRILVTDDNRVNQEVMSRMLNLEGLRDIEVANDGVDAIEKVKASISENKPFDIIFMDVQMPRLDGRKCTMILRETYHMKIPIVAVSAYANDENIQECLNAGMTVFLAKPLRRPSLRKLLQSLSQESSDSAESKSDTSTPTVSS